MTSPAEVLAAARGWLGVPWVHQGRVRAGVDCVGLVVVLAWQLGLLPASVDVTAYGRRPEGDRMLREIAEHCLPLPAPTAGAVLVMRMPWNPQHLAIAAGGTVIHATVGRGVIEQAYRGALARRTVSAWALPGVAYA